MQATPSQVEVSERWQQTGTERTHRSLMPSQLALLSPARGSRDLRGYSAFPPKSPPSTPGSLLEFFLRMTLLTTGTWKELPTWSRSGAALAWKPGTFLCFVTKSHSMKRVST